MILFRWWPWVTLSALPSSGTKSTFYWWDWSCMECKPLQSSLVSQFFLIQGLNAGIISRNGYAMIITLLRLMHMDNSYCISALWSREVGLRLRDEGIVWSLVVTAFVSNSIELLSRYWQFKAINLAVIFWYVWSQLLLTLNSTYTHLLKLWTIGGLVVAVSGIKGT